MIAKPKEVEDLTARLTDLHTQRHWHPSWTQSIAEFSRSRESKRSYSVENLVSYLSEVQFRLALEKACDDLGISARFDPIPLGAATDNYLFAYNGTNLEALDAHTKQKRFEYDLVIEINGFPVVFEIKLGKYSNGNKNSLLKSHGPKRKRLRHTPHGPRIRAPSNFGVKYAMDPQRIEDLLSPVMEHYDTWHVGYVIVTDPKNIKPHRAEQQEFLRRNGLLIPWYKTKMQYREEVITRAGSLIKNPNII